MNTYIGTKIIDARPMTLGEYNEYRDWVLPENEDGGTPGFLVEYTDGGKPNHPSHDGYISWSPADVFNKSYCQTSGMNFGQAVEAVKKGLKVARTNWNGKGMFIFLVPRFDIYG